MKNRMYIAAALAAFGLIAGACQLDVERNDDGSLQIEAVIDEADIAREIELGMDPDTESVTVDLKDGYAQVDVVGVGDTGRTEEISFRLELFVDVDHLGAEVSEATWNGIEIPEAMVEIWNEELAQELEASAKEDPDSTLAAVEITEGALRFEFHVETKYSKS